MLTMRRFTDDQKKSVRHWAMEFVVVVVGVLLALWLQGWWERQRALSDMRAAEEAIHDEVRTALEALVWRKAISKCHIDRLSLLKSMLLKGDDSWPGLQENPLTVRSPVPQSIFPGVYFRPADAFTTAAWSSALTSGALAPMDRERFAKLVAVYDQIEAWRRARDDETEAVSALGALAFPIRLTPELRAQFLQSLYRVDRARFSFGFPSPADLAESMRELGWNDAVEIDRGIRRDNEESNRLGFVWRRCLSQPLNPFRERPFSAI